MASKTTQTPRIALIQLHIPSISTPSSQFHRASKFIRQAASEKVDLAILPEMCLGFCEPSKMLYHAAACATELERLQELAKELNINIIPGSYLSVAATSTIENPKFHNTTCCISPDGTIQHVYHKVNLWGSERLSCIPGTEHVVFDTPEFGKIGLLICWDLAFPEAFRSLISLGAQYIFIPTLWKSQDCGPAGLAHGANSEVIFIDSIITARAYEQNAVIVFCNVGGEGSVEEAEKAGYFGASQITMPFKGQIARSDGREQCLVVDVVDVGAVLKDAEEVWGIRGDVGGRRWYLKG